MSDKTCGTCRHALRPVVYCGRADERANTAGLHATGEPGCRSWADRGDSVEQVALDMLELIRAAKRHPIVLRPNAMRGGQIMQPDPDSVFAERLEVLGVQP